MNGFARKVLLAVVVFAVGAGLTWAQGTTIQIRQGPNGVSYLTDSKGMTLYFYTKDADAQSACTGGCATAWPVFCAPTITIPAALDMGDFATITRGDGAKQTTYRGYPLYYWIQDTKRGDTTGQDVEKVWYVIDPAKFPPSK